MDLRKNVEERLSKGFPFSVIYKKDKFIINGKEYPLGYTSYLLANSDYDYVVTPIFDELKQFVEELIDEFSQEKLIAYRDKLNEVLSLMGTYEIFKMLSWDEIQENTKSYFTEHMMVLYENYSFFLKHDVQCDDMDRLKELAIASNSYDKLLAFGLYLYNANEQVDKYCALVFHITREIMKNNARTRPQLAKSFQSFLKDDVMRYIHDYSSTTLRMETTTIPVVIEVNGEEEILRKVYYKNIRDFLFTDVFEGFIHGHYLWQCDICDKYFFMTTAHKQLYCSTVNPEYDVPCSYVAKHPEKIKRKVESQSKTVSTYYVTWNKRYSSIRRNKYLGKYDEIVSAKAKKYIDECFTRAQIDFDYAENKYEKDMVLENIYNEVLKELENENLST